jgi:hypothetical protein
MIARWLYPFALLSLALTSGCFEETATSAEGPCDAERAASCQNLYDECVLFGGEPGECQDAAIEFFECPVLNYVAGAGNDCEASVPDESTEPGFLDINCTPVVELELFDASIRAIHLSPDAPAVDVYVGSEWVYRSVGPDLSFGEASEFYPSLPGYDLLTVASQGTPAEELLFDDPAILQLDDLNLPAGCYTTVVYDRLASIDVLVLEDDYSPIREGTIRVRAVHAAPSVGQVDLYDVSDAAAPTLLEEDLDFGTAGTALDLPAVAFSLGLDVDDDGVSDLVFDVPALAEGSVVNAFATEDDTGDIAVIAQLDNGATARIDPR